MNFTKSMFERSWSHFKNDSLRRNSLFLIIGQAVNAIAMFFFWIIIARVFNVTSVGLAAAFISLATLVATFTQLGMGNTTVRFMPSVNRKGAFFSAALIITIFGSCIGGIIVLFLLPELSSRLSFVRHSYLLGIVLIGLVMLNSVTGVIENTMLSFRKGEYLAYKSLVTNAPKFILPFLVVALAMKGIVLAYAISLLLGIIYALCVIRARLLNGQVLLPDFNAIWSKRHFTAGNYIGSIASILPNTLLPLIVLQHLGAESAAYLYMPMQLTGFLVVIASSASQSFLSESSQEGGEGNYSANLKSAFTHTFKMVIPAALMLVLIGWVVLRAYGKAYASNGFLPMILLTVASLFVAINTLGDTSLLVKRNMRAYVCMQVLNAALVITCVLLLMKFGLVGVASGWLLGQSVTAAVYVSLFEKDRLIVAMNNLGA